MFCMLRAVLPLYPVGKLLELVILERQPAITLASLSFTYILQVS